VPTPHWNKAIAITKLAARIERFQRFLRGEERDSKEAVEDRMVFQDRVANHSKLYQLGPPTVGTLVAREMITVWIKELCETCITKERVMSELPSDHPP
jgi:hypothetical protein